jgi:hypothetical protein
MQEFLLEPVELTDDELQEVAAAGGGGGGQNSGGLINLLNGNNILDGNSVAVAVLGGALAL